MLARILVESVQAVRIVTRYIQRIKSAGLHAPLMSIGLAQRITIVESAICALRTGTAILAQMKQVSA